MSKKVIYIAGPMASDPDYEEKFNAAESYLSWKDWAVLSPAHLPTGMKPGSYMPICLAMVQAADAVCLLSGSDGSKGAIIERNFAVYQGKPCFNGVENVPNAATFDMLY